MKKFLAFMLLLTVSACGMSACKNKPCSTMKPYVDLASNGLASALQCSNPEAVKADVFAMVEKKGWCKADQTGPVAMLVCPIVVNAMAEIGLSQLPASWGCKATMAQDGLIAACNLIPF
jgi:hypothetical protein